MRKIYISILAMLSFVAVHADEITKTGEITSDETWTADNTYFLNGFVFVKSGATLSIEPGTVVKGLAKSNITSGDFTSALIITRGAMIDAKGTFEKPIIFTSELDDVNDPEDLDLTDESSSRGLWGGVILLGNAVIGDESSEATIEGLPAGENSTYGGSDDSDNSGIMTFCSIRHGGAEIVTDEEINGLSLGGVGSGTTLENIEVTYNKDDGIEFFGGTVSIKWAVVSYCGDDSYDWDLGWRGNGQFWVAIGDTEAGDHGGEWDGCKPDDNARNANPNIYNFTFIGGYDGTTKGAAKNEHAIIMRDGTAGTVANGIVAGYNNYALQIEETSKSKHSFGYMKDGDLKLMNNIWHDFGAGSSWDDVILATPETGSANHLADVKSHLSDNNNELAASGINLDRSSAPKLVPGADALAATKATAALPSGSWFSTANYVGAFEPGVNGTWAMWTVAKEYELADFTATRVNGTDITLSGTITEDETWTSNNTYYLDGFVFVDEGATLTINAGTIVKGLAKSNITSGDFTSALVVTRGGKIDAQGTMSQPIIFTSELDDVADAEDIDLTDESASRGLWGGVILLGKAPIGDESSEATIEGLPAGENSTYGGSVEDDNSGIMTYISIRHGGAEIVTDEEINGLSLGGVGSGTTLENIEVVFNKDDGIEFFGGSVSIKYAIVGYCGDDSYDWDLGWRGNGQFWVSIGDTEAGDHGGEWDGCKPDDNARYANPNIYNFTFIGGYDGTTKGAAKNEHAIIMRDGTAGTVANGIIAGFNNYALQIEETSKSKHSFGYMSEGELKLMNNIWHDFGAGSSWDDIILPTPETSSANHLADVKSHLSDNNNELAASGVTLERPTPKVVPNKFSLAATKTAAALPSGSWFSEASYIGACEPGVNADWAMWSAANAYGLADFTVNTSVEERANVATATVFPNPATDNVTLSFALENNDNINIQVVDLTGKVVVELGSAEYTNGVNQVNINTANLNSGVYFINMTSANSNYTQRLIIE